MLTQDQEVSLIEMITEDFGDDLNHAEFAECCLQMFEDIAGFESLSDSEIQPILIRLWRLYDHH